MADKVPSLTDAIRAAVPAVVRRNVCWWERLDAATLAELEAIRSEWHAGRMPGSKAALSKAIAEQLVARGLSDVGPQGVTTWLGNKG
ncbi:MAG: hypothetical protein ACR2IT_03065 [Pirellulales bacterium]